MSFWHRLLDAIVGPVESGPAPSPRAGHRYVPDSGGAVAVAEPPAPGAAATTEADGAPWFVVEEGALTEPVDPRLEDLPGDGQAVANMLVNKLDGGDLALPPLPRVPEAVLRTLRDRECDLAEVANLVSEDAATATRVLRAANSVLWGGREEISSLRQAVVRLGINAMRTLMMSESLRAAMFVAEKADRERARELWRRSLASAWIMHSLAPLVDLEAEGAFLIGLLHDVGNVIVLRTTSHYETYIHGRIAPEVFDHLSREYHQQFGALVADEWDLPARLKELIRDHHTWPEADDPLRTERLLLMQTDMIRQMLGYAWPHVEYDLLNSRPALELGLNDRGDLPATLAPLPDLVAERVAQL